MTMLEGSSTKEATNMPVCDASLDRLNNKIQYIKGIHLLMAGQSK